MSKFLSNNASMMLTILIHIALGVWWTSGVYYQTNDNTARLEELEAVIKSQTEFNRSVSERLSKNEAVIEMMLRQR